MAEPRELSAGELDLGEWLRPGDGVVVGQACAEPVPLLDALLAQAPRRAERLPVFLGLSWRDLSTDGVDLVSYGALGHLGRLSQLEVVPCHFSALPRLFRERALPGDVALIQVAPPDESGHCSLGVGVDYLADALDHARTIVAEVNDRCPRTRGAHVAWEKIDAYIRTSRPLLEAPGADPGEVELQIADHVAALVSDGETLQLGVGSLPEAILGALHSHGDLGVHSGMVSDGILKLIDAGVVTNACKELDPHVTITGAALGGTRLFDALDERDDIVFRPVSYTHDAGTLAKVGPLCAINSAVEIDLHGQVNSEAARGRLLGAVGGQVDFLRAAVASGGKAIIALPASRIVTALSGPVGTARSDVDWVVTEHGARSLQGLTDPQRADALVELAGAGSLGELARVEVPANG
jgi:acyl-CoA hydrolase